MIYNVYKSYMKDLNRYLTIVNFSEDKNDEETISFIGDEKSPIHHIQLIDTSGSMYHELPELIENVKAVIRKMKKSDFFTVITFSSFDDYKIIFKNVPRDIDDSVLDTFFKALDNCNAHGQTCFSSPISEACTIAEDDSLSVCDNVSVTLFTDGEPVCPWSQEEEDNKVTKLLTNMKDKIISFNTIGYGNYYNRKLLMKWSLLSNFGTFTHSSNIDEYLEIFDNNYDIISNVSNDFINFDINNSEFKFLVQNNNVKMIKDNKFTVNLAKNRNQIIILSEDDDVEIKANGEIIKCENCPEVKDSWKEGLQYKIAYALFTSEYSDKSIEMYKLNLKDKTIIEKYTSSFTPKETFELQKFLKNSAFKKDYRNPNSLNWTNYNMDCPCVLHLLNLLKEHEVKYKWYDTKYSRISRRVKDDFNMFKMREEPAVIDDLVYSEEFLNVSLRFIVKGTVSINPKQAEKVGLEDKVPAKAFRNHTIIKDGNLNVNEITIIVDNSIMNEFSDYNFCIDKHRLNASESELIIHLDKLPLINSYFSRRSIDYIYDQVKFEIMLKSSIKVLKYLESRYEYPVTDSKYSKDQIELLKEYGINKGFYQSISPKTDDETNYGDAYYARTFKFGISGFSTIPSVTAMLKDVKENKCKKSEKYMREALDMFEKYKVNELNELYDIEKGYKLSLNKCKEEICGYKIAKTLLAEPLNLDKDKKGNYIYKDMIIKRDKKLVVI